MDNFSKLIKSKKIIISDGAWGTELAKRGLPSNEAPESWNITHPEKILSVAQAYVDAGADIILTNTFNANKLKLAKFSLADKVYDIIKAGVEISKQAAGHKSLVFVSVGPTGEMIEPLGELTQEEAYTTYVEVVKAIVASGADGIVLETFSALEEIIIALKAVKQNSELPVVASMTFQHEQNDSYATTTGITPERAVKVLEAEGANVIGANCGLDIANMIELCAFFKLYAKKPIWIKSNAGLPQEENGKTVYKETPEGMASKIGELAEAGAVIIGGCCGTTPAHISALVKTRAELKLNR